MITRFAWLALALVSACTGSEVPQQPRGAEPREQDCSAMTRHACMHSTACTLALEGSTADAYTCRASLAPCETGFAQAGFNAWGEAIDEARAQRRACDARAGCAFVDESCYCACAGYGKTAVPDGPEAQPCACDCAGGAPPSCESR